MGKNGFNFFTSIFSSLNAGLMFACGLSAQNFSNAHIKSENKIPSPKYLVTKVIDAARFLHEDNVTLNCHVKKSPSIVPNAAYIQPDIFFEYSKDGIKNWSKTSIELTFSDYFFVRMAGSQEYQFVNNNPIKIGVRFKEINFQGWSNIFSTKNMKMVNTYIFNDRQGFPVCYVSTKENVLPEGVSIWFSFNGTQGAAHENFATSFEQNKAKVSIRNVKELNCNAVLVWEGKGVNPYKGVDFAVGNPNIKKNSSIQSSIIKIMS